MTRKKDEPKKQPKATEPAAVIEAVKDAWVKETARVHRVTQDLEQQQRAHDRSAKKLAEHNKHLDELGVWLESQGVNLSIVDEDNADDEDEQEFCQYCDEPVPDCLCDDPEDG